MNALYTVGHGTLSTLKFCDVLRSSKISRVVDVRARPGSQRAPQFNRTTLMQWLPDAGFSYEWAPELGGYRPVSGTSRHSELPSNVQGFADFMENTAFKAAMKCLLDSSDCRTAIMCAESDWKQCHRRLIADAAQLLFGIPVVHVKHDLTAELHKSIDNPRVESNNLVYDGGVLRLF